ncbi:MAG TPA: alpha-1,2-fucosyltransferase [Acidimicrobiia bacterium]
MRARRPYLVVEYHGRLGNQLFEFASCFGLARAAGAELRSLNGSVKEDDLLVRELLGSGYREATKAQLLAVGIFPWSNSWKKLWQALTQRLVNRGRILFGRGPGLVVLWEPASRYLPELRELHLPVCIRGYLQSEQFFADCADEIVEALHWPPANPVLPAGIGASVGMSFRRGDFNSLGWSLPLSYYDEALALVLGKVPNATLVLFGDDQDFVQLAADRFRRSIPVIDALEIGSDPISQLALLSRCDHCVISNSSFAWWGAWLGDQLSRATDRIVVAPQEYGEAGDRLPERWITLPTGATVF